jgi:hypothetical protein
MTDSVLGDQPVPAGAKTWLFNPFLYIAGAQSLVIGLGAVLAAGWLTSFSNSHFDGVLDFHTGMPNLFPGYLLEGLVGWLSLAVVLFILGKVFSKSHFRAIDLFGTQALARWPTLIIASLALLPQYQRGLAAMMQLLVNPSGGWQGAPADAIGLGLIMLLQITFLIWMVALMYQSYRICTNLRGIKIGLSFVGGLLIGETISKGALWQLMLHRII